MSVQITVRIPDDLAAFVDEQVQAGTASSRADAVATALRHERRRISAARDAAIYAAHTDPELDSLADYAARQPMDID